MKKLTSDEWAGLRPGHAPFGHLRRRGGGRGAHSGGGGRGVKEPSRFPGSAAHRPAAPGCPVRHPLPGAASAGTSCLCCVPCPGEWALPAGGGRAGGHLRPSPFSRPCPLIPSQPPRDEARRRDGGGPRGAVRDQRPVAAVHRRAVAGRVSGCRREFASLSRAGNSIKAGRAELELVPRAPLAWESPRL